MLLHLLTLLFKVIKSSSTDLRNRGKFDVIRILAMDRIIDSFSFKYSIVT